MFFALYVIPLQNQMLNASKEDVTMHRSHIKINLARLKSADNMLIKVYTHKDIYSTM